MESSGPLWDHEALEELEMRRIRNECSVVLMLIIHTSIPIRLISATDMTCLKGFECCQLAFDVLKKFKALIFSAREE